MNVFELVRKYEPVLKFSKDGLGREENFFPMSTADYVAQAALHKMEMGPVLDRTEVSLDYLGGLTVPESRSLYLTFGADETLRHNPSLFEQLQDDGLALYDIQGDAVDPLDPGAVNYGLADITKLPDEVHATALKHYQPLRDFGQHPPMYYYSSIYNRGFLVLQYWFFYAYNDWGTAHSGVNDHEGDWEMIALFLRGEKPVYAAYSAHTGAPARHQWDDPAIEKVAGDHPVVYVGCGSHANYFHREIHAQATFKDYAQGDSAVSVGPGTPVAWGTPVNLAEQSWALNYAGSWGVRVKRYGTSALAMGAQAPVGPPWQFTRWEAPVEWAKLTYF